MPDDIDLDMTAARDEDDKQAFTRVVEVCHHLVRATVLRDTANPELADEIAQEVFVRAWVRRKQYRPGTSPRAWLLAIARTQVMDHHRMADRNRRHMRHLVEKELLRHAAAEERFEEEVKLLRKQALEACMEGIEDHQRELLDLVHAQGLTTEDAAAVLGIKPPTCRQRLSRLQRALRQCAERRMESA